MIFNPADTRETELGVLQRFCNDTECKHFVTFILIYSVGREYVILKYVLIFLTCNIV